MPLKDFVNRHEPTHSQVRGSNSPRTVKQRIDVDDLKMAPPVEPSTSALPKPSRLSNVYVKRNPGKSSNNLNAVEPETLFDTDASTIGDTYTNLDMTTGPVVDDFYGTKPGQNHTSPQKWLPTDQISQSTISPLPDAHTNFQEVRDAMPVVDGDSYPSTTSGNPSEAGQAPFLPAEPTRTQVPETFSYQPMRSQKKHAPQVIQEQHQPPLPHHPVQIRSQQIQRDTFRFAPQGSRQTMMQYKQQQENVVQPISTGIRKDEHVPSVKTRESRPAPVADRHEYARPSLNIPLPRTFHNQPQEQAQISDSISANPLSIPSHELDYDADTFPSMSFEDLKHKPFDHDPRHQAPLLPQRFTRMTLPEQLQDMLGLTPDEQDPFFASLTREQWDQAGDWFLGKFGDVLAQLKDLRCEKRALVEKYEGEIEARHEQIENARTAIEDELTGMKERGPMVLQTTPKKVVKMK